MNNFNQIEQVKKIVSKIENGFYIEKLFQTKKETITNTDFKTCEKINLKKDYPFNKNFDPKVFIDFPFKTNEEAFNVAFALNDKNVDEIYQVDKQTNKIIKITKKDIERVREKLLKTI